MKWIFGIVLLVVAGACVGYLMAFEEEPSKAPIQPHVLTEENKSKQQSSLEEPQLEEPPTEEPEPHLQLSLPPNEVAIEIVEQEDSAKLVEEAMSPPQVVDQKEGTLSLPLGVKVDENEEPLVQFHIQKKSKNAALADAKDKLDGIPVGETPED